MSINEVLRNITVLLVPVLLVSVLSVNFAHSYNASLQNGKLHLKGVVSEDVRSHVNNFLDIAFYYGGAQIKRSPGYSEYIYKEKDLWWHYYITYPDGLPKHGSIHKWNQEITIGVGWPLTPEGRPALNPRSDMLEHYALTEHYGRFLKQIKSLAPEIGRLTGLKVKVIEPNDPIENTSQFAKIRVVPTNRNPLNNYFKHAKHTDNRRGVLENEFNTPLYFEHFYKMPVPFTDGARSQVDGYILPRTNNNIGMSVCKISINVEELLANTLISECLVRALGLPERIGKTAKLYRGSLVGPWNSNHNAHSWLIGERLDFTAVARRHKDVPPKTRKNFPEHLTDKNTLFQTFTDYDAFVISLLYCPEIKSGMDRIEVKDVLQKSECVSRVVEKLKTQ